VSLSSAPGRSRNCFVSVVGLVVTIVSLAACSRDDGPLKPSAAALLQRQVVPADSARYPSPQERKTWSNPYLVIRSNAVGLLTGVTANEEQILKPEEVLNALAGLPASAWPYGRAVAILVDEKPTASEADKIAIRRNRGIVAGELLEAHVAINWISTP